MHVLCDFYVCYMRPVVLETIFETNFLLELIQICFVNSDEFAAVYLHSKI